MEEVIVPVGQDVILPQLVRLIISCNNLINNTSLWNVTWTKNDRIVTNGSEFGAFISQDRQKFILNNPLPNFGAGVKSEGDYKCIACSNDGLCVKKETAFQICSKVYSYQLNP